MRNACPLLVPLALALATILFAPVPLAGQSHPATQVRQLAELTASPPRLGQRFGYSVAVSGSTIVASTNVDNAEGEGSVDVFVRSGNGWTQVAELTDGMTGDGFGYSVAFAGRTIAVAAGGAAYVFVEPAGGWRNMLPTAALTIPDVGESRFADAVAVSNEGTTIVAGAEGDGGLGSGAAYVFVKPPGGWQNTSIPTATLSSISATGLGNSVAIGDDVIVAGSIGYGLSVGPAYVFVKPPTGWQDAQPTAALTPSDQVGNGGQFSKSVAISGNTVVAGAPVSLTSGTAYVFVEPPGGWQDMTQTAELTVSSRTYNSLGYSVVIVGNAVVAGAPTDVIGNTRKGAAFGYLKPSGGWQNTSKPNVSVIASDGAAKDGFGTSVALSSTIAVIGAPQHAVNGQTLPGAAYVFGQQ